MDASAGAALALTAALRGDRSGSLEMAEMALEAARAIGLPEVLMMVLTRISESAVVLGEPERARATLIDALHFLSEIGGRGWVAPTLELAAVVCAGATGVSGPAVRLLGAAQATRELTGESFRFPHHEARLTRLVGEARAVLGSPKFDQEFQRGRHLDTAEAVAAALRELQSEDGEHLCG